MATRGSSFGAHSERHGGWGAGAWGRGWGAGARGQGRGAYSSLFNGSSFRLRLSRSAGARARSMCATSGRLMFRSSAARPGGGPGASRVTSCATASTSARTQVWYAPETVASWRARGRRVEWRLSLWCLDGRRRPWLLGPPPPLSHPLPHPGDPGTNPLSHPLPVPGPPPPYRHSLPVLVSRDHHLPFRHPTPSGGSRTYPLPLSDPLPAWDYQDYPLPLSHPLPARDSWDHLLLLIDPLPTRGS